MKPRWYVSRFTNDEDLEAFLNSLQELCEAAHLKIDILWIVPLVDGLIHVTVHTERTP